MKKTFLLFFSTCLIAGSLSSQTTDYANNTLINKYLQANNKAKKKISKEIIRQNSDFDSLYNRIKQGKQYSTDVQKGFFEHNFKNEHGIEHPNLVFIPYKYNPTNKYQVRLFLHGGISTLDMRQNYSLVNRVDTSWNSRNTICLFPSSWLFSPWWSYYQYENLTDLLRFIKNNFNIDENDIYVTGISDGGTGIFYLSNFFQTPFSCFLPYIGNTKMLTVIPSQQFYIRNYQGLSFLIVNGRKDALFDINYIIPSVKELKKTAKEVKFFVVDSSGHSTGWYPILKDTIKNFIKTHRRNPYPNEIYYATEKPDTFNRKFWVVIDMIGKAKENSMGDSNKIDLNNLSVPMFPRGRLFGQIEVNKLGNIVYIKTQNVIKYTLLISPDHFDLRKPIVVYTNNHLSYEGLPQKNLRTLLKYNILDNDRTMLFSSELKITVGKTKQEKSKITSQAYS